MTAQWSFPRITDQLSNSLIGLVKNYSIENDSLQDLEESLGNSSKWGIACSGGADSTFLLFLINALFPKHGDKLLVLHFNHGARGSQSYIDQQFVESLGQHLGMEVVCEKRKKQVKIDEASMRNDRIEFFSSISKNRNISHILFGHHADDVAETMLWRLPRSSTIEGMAGPRPVTKYKHMTFIRPMLCLSRLDIVKSLEVHSIPWREDQSNNEDSYLRNRLRHQVVPKWKEVFHAELLKGVSMSRKLFQQDSDALSFYAKNALNECTEGSDLSLCQFNSFPKAIRRRVLRKWILTKIPTGISFDGQEEELINQINCGKIKTCDLPGGVRLEIKDGVIKCDFETLDNLSLKKGFLPIGQSLYLPTGECLSAKCVALSKRLFKKIRYKEIDQYKEAYLTYTDEKIAFRSRESGDRYQPIGSLKPKKIGEMMIKAKWCRNRKETTPIILGLKDEIIWIPGFAPSDSLKVTDQANKVIHLTYS